LHCVEFRRRFTRDRRRQPERSFAPRFLASWCASPNGGIATLLNLPLRQAAGAIAAPTWFRLVPELPLPQGRGVLETLRSLLSHLTGSPLMGVTKPMIRLIKILPFLTITWMPSSAKQLAKAEETRAKDPTKAIDVQLENFRPPSSQEREQIEQWLLELDLVPMVADRVAFTATGTYFLAGKGNEKHISNLRQFAIGWSLDNERDRERLLVIDQRLLNPDMIEQGIWRLMQSGTSELDRLRIESTYHEANGTSIYDPGPKSHVQQSMEGIGVFFPTRAATSNPMACWSGHVMDRSKPSVTIDRLTGMQQIGQYQVALFEYRPADFYVFFVGVCFRDGLPVQCDSWRQFRRPEDMSNKAPTTKQREAERDYLVSTAKRVARVQSKWKTLGTSSVPTHLHATTTDDFYEVELVSEIQWFVNGQVSPKAFEPATVGQFGPLSVARQ
jgi:hypothetical protein